MSESVTGAECQHAPCQLLAALGMWWAALYLQETDPSHQLLRGAGVGRQGRGWEEAFLSSHSHPIICASANTDTYWSPAWSSWSQECNHLCLPYWSVYPGVSLSASPVSASFAPWQQLEFKLLPQWPMQCFFPKRTLSSLSVSFHLCSGIHLPVQWMTLVCSGPNSLCVFWSEIRLQCVYQHWSNVKITARLTYRVYEFSLWSLFLWGVIRYKKLFISVFISPEPCWDGTDASWAACICWSLCNMSLQQSA